MSPLLCPEIIRTYYLIFRHENHCTRRPKKCTIRSGDKKAYNRISYKPTNHVAHKNVNEDNFGGGCKTRCGKGALALAARPRRPCYIVHTRSCNYLFNDCFRCWKIGRFGVKEKNYKNSPSLLNSKTPSSESKCKRNPNEVINWPNDGAKLVQTTERNLSKRRSVLASTLRLRIRYEAWKMDRCPFW